MLLAERLAIPDDTSAILWDMDGVLLDTLSQDNALCNPLLHAIVEPRATVDRATIRRFFPFDLPEFWHRILETIAPSSDRGRQDELIPKLVDAHVAVRESAPVALNPGIEDVLRAAREEGLKLAVVSNNPTAQVREMLGRHHNLLPRFDEVIGNDLRRVAKKPAPDSYLFAAAALDVPARRCVVIEDSLLGVHAGRAAGCFVVGVATGSASFEELEASTAVDRAYLSFEANRVAMTPGLVTKKSILTPNDFVSHMIEHLAWRVGCSIDLRWNNSDWSALGRALGEVMRTFPRSRDSAAVLGMIDDGSAEVRLEANAPGRLSLKGVGAVDLDWFLGLRCEQMSSGKPLVDLLGGIADAVPVQLDVTVCSVEDPHHSWEGVFRSVGIAFHRMMVERSDRPSGEDGPEPDEPVESDWKVLRLSTMSAEVLRSTAESEVRVFLDCSGFQPTRCRFDVSDSIHVEGLGDLLEGLSRAAGVRLDVDFKATRLSSSHVVMEDTGMVIGRALNEVLVRRMRRWGINGAGSSVSSGEDLDQSPIQVGLSVEGRKFWKYVPFTMSYEEFRRSFLVGHTVGRGVFSEDLDDFIDGFSGGVMGSIVVHIRNPVTPREGWPMLFRALGAAIAETLDRNPSRKGVTPGVKATLD